MSTLTVQQPDYQSDKWLDIGREQRARIKTLIEVIQEAPARGLAKWFPFAAERCGLKPGGFKKKYYDLKNAGGDWTVLIDNRSNEAVAVKDGTANRTFRAYLLTLVEENKRKNAPAFRELRRRWRVRDQAIPGYEDFPGWPKIPEGWSDRRLAEIVAEETNRATMASIRIGTSSKTNPFLPNVITTRAELWPGAVIQLDDQWHDNFVTTGTGSKLQVVRALELGSLDLFSGHRFHWECKPRTRRDDGTHENINGQDARMYLAAMLYTTGHSSLGTMHMVEHATMSIPEEAERIMYDATGGLSRVDRQPVEGKQAALSGYWQGTEGGNFRAKAALESTQGLIRNDAGALPMQSGSHNSGIKGPVYTERQKAYIYRVLKSVLEKVPHRAHLLKLPTWDFHTQFIPFLRDYYHFGLACRTDHDLEAWATLGHVVTEYATRPDANPGEFLSEEQFLELEQVTREIITHEAAKAPQRWTRRRSLSPFEVWNRRERFRPYSSAAIIDILTPNLSREVKCEKGYLTFKDKKLAPEPLHYEARFISGPRAGREIPHGEKVRMYVLPGVGICVDAKDRFLGEVALYKGVTPVNPDAFSTSAPFDNRPDIRSEELKRAAGRKHQRIADLNAGLDIRHAETIQEAKDLRAHNEEVAKPDGIVTPEDRAAKRAESTRKGTRTRKDNRIAAALGEEALDPANLIPTEEHEDDLHDSGSDHATDPFDLGNLLAPEDED
ncbi:MAG: hypothetical protein AAGI48_03980 [Verrucomicrobiota bacterium]